MLVKDKPRLVAFDLDGTLAESKQPLDADMGALLSRLIEKVPVAVMSGASFEQFETQFLPAIAHTHLERLFIFPVNAAQCYTYTKGNWNKVYDRSFNIFEKGRIMQALKESIEEAGLADDPKRPKEWDERIEDRGGAQITFSALGQKAPVELKKQWDPERKRRKPLYDALVRRLPDFSIGLNATTSIDITQKGVNKSYGIRKLIEIAQISVNEILYVGDALEEGGNDAVVKETGVRTIEVFGPEETAAVIEKVLKILT